LTEEPLGALEDRLAQHGFVRVHRAELVRAAAIRALRSEQGAHELVLEDGQVARVSRRSLAAVRAALGLD
jgi:DNA-binding LytR/AlgR family response regulator